MSPYLAIEPVDHQIQVTVLELALLAADLGIAFVLAVGLDEGDALVHHRFGFALGRLIVRPGAAACKRRACRHHHRYCQVLHEIAFHLCSPLIAIGNTRPLVLGESTDTRIGSFQLQCTASIRAMSLPVISFSISTRISMRSSTVPRPVMYLMSNDEEKSGAGRICSGPSEITSETPSTTIPTTRPATLRTITTVSSLYSASPRLNLMLMSTIGTMMPRRLTTPLMNAGALAIVVTCS